MCRCKILSLSDIPRDPGIQLPYQEFSPYYLAPILLAFSISRSRWIGVELPSLSISLDLLHSSAAAALLFLLCTAARLAVLRLQRP